MSILFMLFFELTPHTLLHIDQTIADAQEALALTGDERDKLRNGKGLGNDTNYIRFWTRVIEIAEQIKIEGQLPDGYTEEDILKAIDRIEELSQ